jgi:hypothetical protein
VEGDQTSGAYVCCELPEHRCRIFLKLQDVASYDGIEGSLEGHLTGIALVENHVPQRPRRRPRPRCFECCRNPIYADNFAFITDNFHGKERDIASAATDVKHTHTGNYPGFTEEPLRYRID